jgi:hypothetical protein
MSGSESQQYSQVDLIRTVTLPHLEPFGISSGLELRVRDSYALPQESCQFSSPRVDQKTWCSSIGWRRSAIPVSYRKAAENPGLYRAWQN